MKLISPTMPLILLACCVITASGAPAWHLLDREEDVVYCLFALDTGTIFIGTDKGLFLYWHGERVNVPLGGSNLPVIGIVRGSHGRLIVAAGAGTYSDAVWEGLDVLDGPPFYDFNKMIDWFPFPQSLEASLSGDTIFAASGNGVYMSVADREGTYGLFERIKTPPNCFGVEMPHAAALHTSRWDGILFAGGYDRSPEPGPGSLLWMITDSMETMQQLNVSAITEGVFFEVGPLEIVIGTTDDGIHHFVPTISSNPWSQYRSPNDEPVRDMITLPTAIWSDNLYVAVASGVYVGRSGNWTEVGDIPATPVCLGGTAVALSGCLLAGTESGLYRYDEEFTAIRQRPGGTTLLRMHDRGPVAAYNPLGRTVGYVPGTALSTTTQRLGDGVYLIRGPSTGVRQLILQR